MLPRLPVTWPRTRRGCPGGLLAEARTCSRRRESSRLPWSCRAARDVAVDVVGELRLRLPARTRRMLHRHVAGTPYLEDREVFRIELVGVPDPGEPAKPVFVGHRAVWDIPFIPVWQTVEESTLGSFREAAADGDGPLALPFASLKARDWGPPRPQKRAVRPTSGPARLSGSLKRPTWRDSGRSRC